MAPNPATAAFPNGRVGELADDRHVVATAPVNLMMTGDVPSNTLVEDAVFPATGLTEVTEPLKYRRVALRDQAIKLIPDAVWKPNSKVEKFVIFQPR